MTSWPSWSLIAWLVIGAVAGIVGRRFVGGTPPFGTAGDAILGLAGGVVGGYIIALYIAPTTGGLIVTLVTAVLGALLLVWLSNRLKR